MTVVFRDLSDQEGRLTASLQKYNLRRRKALLKQLWDQATLEYVDSLEAILTDPEPEQLQLRARLAEQKAEALNGLAANSGLFTWANQRAVLALRMLKRLQ